MYMFEAKETKYMHSCHRRNWRSGAESVSIRAVLMGVKSCTKLLIMSTRFAVEDFVTLFMEKKTCWWGNVFTLFDTWEGLAGDWPPVFFPALIGQRDQEPEYSTVLNKKQSRDTAQRGSNINQPRTPLCCVCFVPIYSVHQVRRT